MNKTACKTQLKSRLKHTRSRRERGKALGAYQKCLKSRGRRGGPKKGRYQFYGGETERGSRRRRSRGKKRSYTYDKYGRHSVKRRR